MTLLVSLVALLIERFFDWSHMRHWRWFLRYQQTILKTLSGLSSYLTLALIIIPFVIFVLVIQWISKDWLYGFFNLLFQLFLLIYCLGPQNFWADAFACINALSQNDRKLAKDKLKSAFNVSVSAKESLQRHFLSTIFIEANRRVFAAVFWYVLLGPAGVVAYRMVTLCAGEGLMAADEGLSKSACDVEALFNWLPIRLFAFCFALGGHFVQVLAKFRQGHAWTLAENEMLLGDCGAAAIGFDENNSMPSDGAIEKHAISLIDRACVFMLVIIAIFYVSF